MSPPCEPVQLGAGDRNGTGVAAWKPEGLGLLGIGPPWPGPHAGGLGCVSPRPRPGGRGQRGWPAAAAPQLCVPSRPWPCTGPFTAADYLVPPQEAAGTSGHATPSLLQVEGPRACPSGLAPARSVPAPRPAGEDTPPALHAGGQARPPPPLLRRAVSHSHDSFLSPSGRCHVGLSPVLA